jgi:hypothetical protein
MEATVELIQQAFRIAWTEGNLSHKLKAPQHSAYDQFYRKRPSRKFVMVGGRRCRKSTFLLILHAECCIRTAGVQTAYVAPVETGLEVYISPIVTHVFSDCPDDLLPRFKDKYLTFPNGSRVVFNGCNMRQYRYMRGQKLALATVDEMAEVDDLESAVDDVLFPAVWDSHGEMVLSGTPPVVPSPDHPVMRYVETAKLTDSYWHATVYDAGYSEDEIAEAMREVGIDGKDSARFKREFLAEFIRDESAVIVPEFKSELHVLGVPESQARPIYYAELYKASGADLGVADKTVALFGYYDFPKGRIIIQREFVLSGAEVRTDHFADSYCVAVRDLGWDLDSSRVQHWSDNSNLMLLNDLSQLHDIHINATDKEQKAEWLNKVRIMFGSGRILIDPSCKLLIATLHGAFWKDELKKDYGRSVALGHMDALDALIYLVRNIRTEVNPFPTNYDLSRGVIYDGKDFIYPSNWNQVPHTDEGRVLGRVFGKERWQTKVKESLPMGGL